MIERLFAAACLIAAATMSFGGASAQAPKPATAIFAGGCFWCVEADFDKVPGVVSTTSGYTGGTTKNPTYQQVSAGGTGHAEAVEIAYDPSKVTYGQLLQVYFSVAHNPTQLNYQGPDQGTQYRSTIFAENGEQKKIAESYIAQLDKAD